MPGAISPNFQEGYRSEYLAQFVFSSWGTAVPTHEQDYGIDLLCTLVERDGQRAWARSLYTVQVKSTMDPWVFEGQQSVRWLVEHPTPLYLCVVDKSSGRVRVYQTSQRFYVWGRGQLPNRISLLPTTEQEGGRPQWPEDGEDFSLDAPILDFSIADFLPTQFVTVAKNTLETWIKIDEQNLRLFRNGIRKFVVPIKYTTNQSPDIRTSASYKRHKTLATPEEMDEALPPFQDSLENMGMEFFKAGDIRGATLALLLHRHVFPSKLFPFMNEIDDQLARTPDRYRHVGIERFEAIIDGELSAVEEARKPNT